MYTLSDDFTAYPILLNQNLQRFMMFYLLVLQTIDSIGLLMN